MMKILYAPLTFVWAILMVSCSSDDDLIERITPAQWSREVTDSDVKIRAAKLLKQVSLLTKMDFLMPKE